MALPSRYGDRRSHLARLVIEHGHSTIRPARVSLHPSGAGLALIDFVLVLGFRNFNRRTADRGRRTFGMDFLLRIV